MPQRVQIRIAPGTNKDATDNNTPQYVDISNARFWQNDILKDAGFTAVGYANSQTVDGCARWLFNFRNPSNNNTFTLIGTHLKLYAVQGNVLVNITPLVTATTAIANSLDSDFNSLATDPLDVTSGSKVITVNQTAHGYAINDSVIIAGATDTGGIPAAQINATHAVASVPGANSYTLGAVATAASSTTSGGGASVTSATALMTVNQTAHGFLDGDRVLLAGAVNFAGLLATEINAEHLIRDKQTNSYVVKLTTKATSSATSGGGASTTVQGEIPDGQCDASNAVGAGLGLAGAGLAGTAKTGNLVLDPRIYSGDLFGDNVILSPSDNTAVYEWTGTTTTAPAIPSGAPTDNDYVYVSDNIIVSLTGNTRTWSDIGESNDWTPAVDSSAGSLTIRGAKPFISHVHLNGINLEYTQSQTYVSRFVVGSAFVWKTELIEPNVGIIARNARIVLNSVAYWVGQDDFHMSSGGQVISIPNNTIRKFFFDNLNKDQRKKIFMDARTDYQEVRIWYPSTSGSGEIDRVITYNTVEGHFSEQSATEVRLAAAQETTLFDFPRLVDLSGELFNHEDGETADGSAMVWFGKSNFSQIAEGTQLMRISGFIPDSTATEDITIKYTTKLEMQDASPVVESTNTITTTTDKVDFRATGRLRQFQIGGTNSAAVRVGAITEIVQEAGRR